MSLFDISPRERQDEEDRRRRDFDDDDYPEPEDLRQESNDG